jgi:protein NrfC
VTRERDIREDECQKTVSRRAFLKCAGTIVLVMGSGTFTLANGEPRIAGGRLKIDDPILPSDGYLLVDVEKCQGCASCMLACSLVHEGVQSQSLSRIQILQSSFDPFPNDVDISQCRQCAEPACVDACPEAALTADAEFGNVRRIDRTKCVGCGECEEACPFTPSRSVMVTGENLEGEDRARKCDLCADTPYHWDDAGGGPDGKQACVAVCPVGAIRFTKQMPVQEGDGGYKVNLRDETWRRLGYPA